jgi:hypothetical protein
MCPREIGLHILGVWVGRIVFEPVAAADQHCAGDVWTIGGMQAFVENVGRDVGRAGGMADEIDAMLVAAEFRCILLRPLDHPAHIVGRRWPLRPRRQAVGRVEAEYALAGEPSSDVAVHLPVDVLVAAHVGAAVDKDHDRRAGPPDRLIDVKHLLGIVAISEILPDDDAILGRRLEQRPERRGGRVDILTQRRSPFRASAAKRARLRISA